LAFISTKGLTYVYGQGTPFVKQAITDINIDIELNTTYALIGHTGSGKSTLVQHLNGLIKPTLGQVIVDGVDIWSNHKNIRDIRFQVGLVFQYPEYQLFDETVAKDIAFGPRNLKLDEAEIKNRVEWAADVVGLKPSLLEKSPFDLSGGEKRRAAIAGVLAMKPKVLVLDEPTAGLDPKGRDSLLECIKDYREQSGAAIIFVSHSMEDVAKVADNVIVMNNGRVELCSDTRSVFSHHSRLNEIGLNVPSITRIMAALKAKGVDLSENILTVEEAKQAILRVVKNGGES